MRVIEYNHQDLSAVERTKNELKKQVRAITTEGKATTSPMSAAINNESPRGI